MADNISLSELSLNSSGSAVSEDWDRSESAIDPDDIPTDDKPSRTPRNSVIFPADMANGGSPGRTPSGKGTQGKRSLSELLKLHAEKGTRNTFSQEEASRVALVLGEWINSGPGPYEKDDDFFTRSHDDIQIPSRSSSAASLDPNTAAIRPRGQSESSINNTPGGSRPTSSLGQVKT